MNRFNRRYIFPILLILFGFALIFGAIFWFYNAPSTMSARTPTPTEDVRIPFPEIQRVSLADAKAAYDLGTAVFVDVRGELYYSEQHIPGALSITEEELPQNLSKLDPQAWIILYCT